MEFQEFMEILKEKAEIINVKIDKEQGKKFYKYMNLLINWNEKINLTAIINPYEIIVKHFIDSLTIEKEIGTNTCIIDIGTGAGFPGIPLKIIRPDISVTLLDSLQKRINFLTEVINLLELENIVAIHGRIEEAGQDNKYREQFDYVTSRAVANLAVLTEYMLPLVKINGKCIAMKGTNIEDEIKNSKKSINIMGGKIERIEKFLLADTDNNRNIVIVKKEKSTPKQYPRKPGIPAKKPIM